MQPAAGIDIFNCDRVDALDFVESEEFALPALM
jgi:hypothetical protein